MSTKWPTGRPKGRPSKKVPATIDRILRVARSGLPLKFAAAAGGIAYDVVLQRSEDEAGAIRSEFRILQCKIL